MENYKKLFEENRSGSLSKEINLINQYPELHKKIIDYAIINNLDIPFKQKIYHFINQIPKVPTCKTCNGNSVNFWTVNSGYKAFCSVKCSKNNSETNEKYKATLLEKYGTTDILNAKSTQDKIKTKRLEKYGVEHHAQSKEWVDEQKEKNIEKYGVESYFITDEFKEKAKKTCNEKYGTDYFSQTDEFKHNMETNNPMFNNDTKEKIKNTCIERYGVASPKQYKPFIEKGKVTSFKNWGFSHPSKSQLVKDKIIRTNIEKYSVPYFSQTSQYARIYKNTWNNKNIEFYKSLNLNFLYHIEDLPHFQCNEGHEFSARHKLIYLRNRLNQPICTVCNPINRSWSLAEREISEWLSQFIELELNSTEILGGLELDIYVPLNKLAIEYNGLYWHSELFKDENYHLNKKLKCKDKGIKLIHIFEDLWIYKKEIVKGLILNQLKLNTNSIGARKCIIKEVSSSDSKEFLENNHLQGNVNASIRYGLYYNNELVSIMTFGKPRISLGHKASENSYELLRFCNKLNYNVSGGASKLLKHFMNIYNPTELMSYADYSWSDGEMYETLGFTLSHISSPNYSYVVGSERHHRYNYRKDILVKNGFDSNKTEKEIMFDRGIWRIYDCGSMLWKINI